MKALNQLSLSLLFSSTIVGCGSIDIPSHVTVTSKTQTQTEGASTDQGDKSTTTTTSTTTSSSTTTSTMTGTAQGQDAAIAALKAKGWTSPLSGLTWILGNDLNSNKVDASTVSSLQLCPTGSTSPTELQYQGDLDNSDLGAWLAKQIVKFPTSFGQDFIVQIVGAVNGEAEVMLAYSGANKFQEATLSSNAVYPDNYALCVIK